MKYRGWLEIMDAKSYTFRQILDPTQNQFIIPFFQRGFVWEQPLWEGLLNDVLDAITNDAKLFIGAIVLKKINDKQHLVIDGQQRLTTLCLLAAALRSVEPRESDNFNTFFINEEDDKVSEDSEDNNLKKQTNKLILVQSHQSEEDFTKVMYLTSIDKLSPTENQSNIIDAYKFFHSKFAELSSVPTITKFMKCIQLVKIDLSEDEDEQKIFDTINFLGIRLTTADLLKNFLYTNKELDFFYQTWGAEFEKGECRNYWDSDITLGRLTNKNIDLFLYYYLQIVYFRDRKRLGRKYDNSTEEKNIRKKDLQFSNYKSYIERFKINKKEFITDLMEYAKKYNELIQPLLDDIPRESGFERLNYIISALDCTTVIPYILYLSQENDDKTDLNKMYEYIEIYLMRRILSGAKNNNYSDLFTENLIGSEINNFEKLKDYIENQKNEEDALSMPSDQKIHRYVLTNEFRNDKALPILYLIESTKRSEMACTHLHRLSNYSLEHLMPKKWEKNWPLPECNTEETKKLVETRNSLINTLGNMGIISKTLNTSISNAAWNNKLEGNRKNEGLKACASGIDIMSDVIASEKWDEQNIQKRSEKLYQDIIKLWPVKSITSI